jgi:long-chain acyl-CoA synthetase
MSDAVKTPIEMFYHWERTTPDKVYLRQPKDLQWSEYTWAQVGDQARRLATFIRSQGYPKGSCISIWSSNSKDWIVVDLAIMMSGHISVPLYPGQDVKSARYILEHSETRMIFLGAFDHAADADQAIPDGITRVAMLGCKVPCPQDLESIIASNEPFEESPVPDPGSIFTMIYTSGTTGNPKGVMHAHETPGHVVPGLARALRMEAPGSRFFSFLPLSHAAERIAVEMTSLYVNAEVSFSEKLANFADELRSVQPTFFFAVPRLWVKFKEGVDAKIPPAAQASLSEEQKAGLRRQLGLANARCILTGASPCPRDVQQWYIDLGILLRDGYGMTENFIHGSSWVHDDKPLPGCVGRPFDETVELRISDEGEIQFRSKGLMKGYYKNPEKTAEVIDEEGWYHTGDSGRLDEEGNLWVTGRIGEVFKSSKGKFVQPVALENHFGRCELLAQLCVFGHGLDQPVLLCSLSESGKKKDRAEVQALLETLLAEVNEVLPPYERLAQIFVTRDEWAIDNGLLTPTMKLKRRPIEERYRPVVEKLLGKASVVFE